MLIISMLILTITIFIFGYLLTEEHLEKAEKKMIKKIVKERLNKK